MSDVIPGDVDAADVDIEEFNKKNPEFTPDVVDAAPEPSDVVDLDEEAGA